MAAYLTSAQRNLSAVAAAALVAALAIGLVLALRGGLAARGTAALMAFAVEPRPQETAPPPKPKRPAQTSAARGQPAPPGLKAQATPVVAAPVPTLLPPPPVVTAPLAGTGSATSNGAAPVPGPGQGAGGAGNGLGGGGRGGDGAGEPSVVGPRRIAGKLSIKDLPDGMVPPGREVAVTVLFRVSAEGRVSDCGADRSSGLPALDKLVCDLIEQRFRYRPALGRSGQPVASRVIETHSWYVEPEPVRTRR